MLSWYDMSMAWIEWSFCPENTWRCQVAYIGVDLQLPFWECHWESQSTVCPEKMQYSKRNTCCSFWWSWKYGGGDIWDRTQLKLCRFGMRHRVTEYLCETKNPASLCILRRVNHIYPCLSLPIHNGTSTCASILQWPQLFSSNSSQEKDPNCHKLLRQQADSWQPDLQ